MIREKKSRNKPGNIKEEWTVRQEGYEEDWGERKEGKRSNAAIQGKGALGAIIFNSIIWKNYLDNKASVEFCMQETFGAFLRRTWERIYNANTGNFFQEILLI